MAGAGDLTIDRQIRHVLHRMPPGDRFRANGVREIVPHTVDREISYHLVRGHLYEQAEAQLIRRTLAPGTKVLECCRSIGMICAVIRAAIGATAIKSPSRPAQRWRRIAERTPKA